jgi:hypothetical protein
VHGGYVVAVGGSWAVWLSGWCLAICEAVDAVLLCVVVKRVLVVKEFVGEMLECRGVTLATNCPEPTLKECW